jgi:phage I-like protein
MKLHVLRISNGAQPAQDGSLPARLKLLGWGDNPAIRGINAKVGLHTLRTMPELMRSQNMDKVALDFEHNTVQGTPAYMESCEPRCVAAFGTPRIVEGEGLFLEDLVYTPQGQTHALNFIDLSPAVHIDPKTGEVDFLHSVALTRAGAVEGLSFFSVEAGGVATTAKGDAMDWKDFIKSFNGSAEDATDEQIKEAFGAKVKALAAEAAAPAVDSVTALSARVAGLATGAGNDGELTALSATVAGLTDEVTALSAELVAMRRQAVCEQAVREGKVIPLSAEQITAMDPATLAEMVGKLPPTVPMDRRTPEHIKALSSSAADSALKAVALKCGMDPQKVMEANKR